MSGEPARGAAKVCTGCGELVPLAGYHRDRTHRDGRASRCAECVCAALRKPGGRGPNPPVVPPGEPRRCTGPCATVKPPAAFAPRPGRPNGREARCRACVAATAARRAARTRTLSEAA
jgi:hypothetical protein